MPRTTARWKYYRTGCPSIKRVGVKRSTQSANTGMGRHGGNLFTANSHTVALDRERVALDLVLAISLSLSRYCQYLTSGSIACIKVQPGEHRRVSSNICWKMEKQKIKEIHFNNPAELSVWEARGVVWMTASSQQWYSGKENKILFASVLRITFE